MKRLIYTSNINPDFPLTGLVQIMEQAVRANKIHGVTGLLIFTSLNFAQWLEGEDHVVDRLYANIIKDVRHSQCTKREDTPIAQRHWPRWAMNLGLLVNGDTPFVGKDPAQRVNLNSDSQSIESLHTRFFEAAKQLPSLQVSFHSSGTRPL